MTRHVRNQEYTRETKKHRMYGGLQKSIQKKGLYVPSFVKINKKLFLKKFFFVCKRGIRGQIRGPNIS